MKLLEYFKLACYEIWHNKLRTFLTLIGIIIGIAAIIIIVTVVQGAEKFVVNEVKKVAPAEILEIYPRWNPATYRPFAQLTMEDIHYLERNFGDRIQAIAPQYWTSEEIRYQDQNHSINLIATTESYQTMYNLAIEKGQFFSQVDVENLSQVLVLGADLAEELFAEEDPIGQKIQLWNSTFTVIGVLTKNEQSMIIPISMNDGRAYFPYSVWERFTGVKDRFSLLVQLTDSSLMSSMKLNLQTALDQRHGLDKNGQSKFWRSEFSGGLDQLSTIKIVLTILLSGVAGITLLVAGIGVMNIMLVIVAERKKEIGLRKALGGTKFDILSQLIIESIILCLVGGVFGVLAGYLGSNLAFMLAKNFIPNIQSGVPFWAVILSFGTTTCVGLFFGIYPAFKAAKLDPIQALHHE